MDSIIRGTNAMVQIKIKEDLDFATITALELHIYQSTRSIVKTLEDLTLDAENQTVKYELTQSESLNLVANLLAEITLIGIAGGKRFETRPAIRVNVEKTHKNEVMI